MQHTEVLAAGRADAVRWPDAAPGVGEIQEACEPVNDEYLFGEAREGDVGTSLMPE